MRQVILEALQAALNGSRKVKIVFKKDELTSVAYLLGMERNGGVILDVTEKFVLGCVLQSRNWDGDHNRHVTITLTEKFDESWFVSRMERAIEKIEVAK